MATKTIPDAIIAWLNPEAGLRRAQARKVLAYYEAAKSDRLRKSRKETGTGNTAVLRAGSSLRQQARHMEQNYDLALGVLNTLTANIVGPNGIGIEPQPRRADGSIDDELSRQILELWRDWSARPEVTWRHDWPSMQRMLCRSWLRDGEVFAQVVAGLNPALDHGTRVPLSLEMLEADYVPFDLQKLADDNGAAVVQGIEINAWGRPTAYHVYKAHPLEASGVLSGIGQTKRIPADRMLHLANIHRVRQLRGVSVFASVLQRFDDLKDYEESERIAAKIAASMAAFIKKGNPDMYDPEADDASTPRSMSMRPGMIFDDLKPGEEIGMIDTNRPNPNLETYRSGQMRAIASGTGPTYSSLARSYDGTYSAQRQELVEGWTIYGTLASEFIGRIIRPVYERFIAIALASGQIKRPAGVRLETLDDAIYLPPQMPWIDPEKEAAAFETLEKNTYASGPEIIRRRGGNPLDVLEQQARWMREKDARGIPSAAAQSAPPAPAEDPGLKAAQAMASAHVQAAEINRQALASAAAPVFNVAAPTITLPAHEIHNHLPAAHVTVESPDVQVDVAAPVVNMEAVLPEQPAPQVTINNQIDQPAPQVTINNAVAAAEIRQVEIVSLPARETTTAIERDKAGNILKTTQTETDA